MTRPLFMARLAGTQAEMGAQHGRLVAADASHLVEFYRTLPERTLAGGMTGIAGRVGRVAARGLARAWQERLLRDRPRELVARSRAFMAAVAPDDPRTALLTLAAMDSLQNCVSLAARGKIGPFANPLSAHATVAAVPACSSIIAWGDATEDGELLFARNFDFPGVGVWDAAPAFVVCRETGGQRYGFFATRGADAPVVTVVNEAGLVLAPHTRWHVGVRFGGAMIVDLVHDIARRAETLADAVAIARERPISSTWGIAVGSARERSGLVLEIAGASVEVVRPAAGASYQLCANRYRSEALQVGQVASSAAWALHSERRERRLRELMETRAAPLDMATMARFLGDRRDVDAPATRRRLGGILAQPTNVHCAVVGPAACRALVGVDRAPCCEGRWADLAWQWDGPGGGWELGATDDRCGFTATVREDIVAPHDAATLHVREATRAFEATHDLVATRTAIERAVAADTVDPSLRLAAAWLALAADDHAVAVEHVHAGLAREHDGYRRGQLLLWGARAAAEIDPAQAARWHIELAALDAPHVDELQAAAGQRRRRPQINLVMVDAY